MNFRPKTLHRLLVLVIGMTAATAVGVVLVTLQLQRYERHRMALRSAGIAAFERLDYHQAADLLSKYLGNDRMDPQAILDCAVARSKLARPDMGNLLDARRQFNRYLELKPGDVQAEHQLLVIYQKLHYSAESTLMVDKLLSQNPDDVPALLARLQQLVHDSNFTAALPISARLNKLSPDDLRTQETTYFLMSKLNRPAADLTTRADDMLKSHPREPRCQLLCGVAAYYANDIAGAQKQFRIAAAAPTAIPPDADFTLMLVSDFDRLGMWSDAMAALQHAASQPNASPDLKVALVQRLWEFKEYDAASSLLNGLNPNDPKTDSRLIGLDALLLGMPPRNPGQFKHDLDALKNRPDDMSALGWALLFDAESKTADGASSPPLEPRLAAERADPDNPDIRYDLAEQYDRMGENELALQCMKQVTQMQPEWPAPWSEISRILLARGQTADAVAPAQAACDRFPKSFTDHVALEKALHANLPAQASAAQIQPVLDLVHQLRESRPTDQSLIAAEVDLLARLGHRSEAIELALSAGSDADPADPATLAALSTVDRNRRLGLSDQLVHEAESAMIRSPEDAAAEFEIYINSGASQKANQLLVKMQHQTGNGWKLAWLQARDKLGSPPATGDWEQFADSQPDLLSVQQATLQSPSATTNRALIDRTIDRLKKLTGDDCIEWKLARARWLLGATDNIKGNANAAAELMAEVARICPDYAEPRVLWAEALAKADDINGAIASLQLAAGLHPHDPRIAKKLADLIAQREGTGVKKPAPPGGDPKK